MAFITYALEDGSWKHKKAWDNWIDPDIPVIETTNAPSEGFVINKREGGGGSWSYDEREAKIRVWTPNNGGYEFEITIENMLDLLAISGSIPGKGLEGEFVYGYQGNRLFLIPTASESYKISSEFTDLNKFNVEAKDLIVGALYITKSVNRWIYMGLIPWIEPSYYDNEISVEKSHIFYNADSTDMDELDSFQILKIKDLSKCLDSNPVEGLADLIEAMQNTGKCFTRDMVMIKPKSPQFKLFKTRLRRSNATYEGDSYEGDSYEGDSYWIKRDETTYESVKILYQMSELKPGERSWDEVIQIGVRLIYQKKLVISADLVVVKKSSKIDKEIYQRSDLMNREFFGVYINTSVWAKKEIGERIKKGYGNPSDSDRYSIKQLN